MSLLFIVVIFKIYLLAYI